MLKNNKYIAKYNSLSIEVKAALWYLVCSFLQRGITFITTPIFTRLLTKAEYGEYNVFSSWQGILTVIITLYLPWGVFEQGLIKFENEKKRFISSLQVLLALLVLAWTGIYILFRHQVEALIGLGPDRMIPMLMLMWTSSVFCFWSNAQRADYKYRSLVLITILVAVIKPAAGIFAVVTFPNRITARIWSNLIVDLLFYTGLFISQVRTHEKVVEKRFWTYAVPYNMRLIPHYLSQTVLSGADRIMIERMVNNEAAGLYGLAYSISQLMLIFNTALLQTIGPWVYRRIREKAFKETTRVMYPTILLVAAFNLLLILLAPEIILVFGSRKYLEAIWVVPPVAMSTFFIYLYGLFSYFEFYAEKTSFISMFSTFGALLNIILNYIFIKQFGYVAAGYTTLICYILYAACHYYVMLKKCLNGEKVFELKKLLGYTIGFVAIGFGFMMTYYSNIVRYSVTGVLALCAIIFYKKIYQLILNLFKLRKEQ